MPPEIELPAIAEVDPPEIDEELDGRAFGTEIGFGFIDLFRKGSEAKFSVLDGVVNSGCAFLFPM